MQQVHGIIELLARLLEVAGVAIILAGVVLASALFIADRQRCGDWRSSYDRYRANLGRGILLGLELLVGADIIGTITAPLTLSSVGLLAVAKVGQEAGRTRGRNARALSGDGGAMGGR